jgi:Common central domain of tyrosinase
MKTYSPPRRNVSQISERDRDSFIKGFIALNNQPEFVYPGTREDKPFVGGVTFWFKQDEIHQATHVHRGPAFLTWHRELCRRFENNLRLVDSELSLHYWDWNEDPGDTKDKDAKSINLFTSSFMGSANGDAQEPWLSAGFYNSSPVGENYRGIDPFDTEHSNPADPPVALTREKPRGTLKDFMEKNGSQFFTDEEIIRSTSYGEMRIKLERVHNWAHSYIGGTIGDPHTSFRDPFVFLLHSNVDRLFAGWQLVKGNEWRLDAHQVYGPEASSTALGSTSPYVVVGIKTMMSPWCGVGYPYECNKPAIEGELEEPGVYDVRPWTYPENIHRDPNLNEEMKPKNSLHISVINPPMYDRFPDIAGIEYSYDGSD